MNWDLLDWSIVGPALVAGLLVLTTHVPLGQEVLQRGIIFIDLAIAQVAALGVIIASITGGYEHGWQVQAAAVVAALLAAVGLNWTEKRWPRQQEALIGILFVLAASTGILLLASDPHGGENLRDLLVGQILWSTWSSILPLLVLNAVLLAIWLSFKTRIGPFGFYVTFAFAVTAAVQVVGVYLVFASLIIPALATLSMQSGARRLLTGYAVGGLAYLSGIVISALFDLPTGAVIVLTMAGCGVLAGFAISWLRGT